MIALCGCGKESSNVENTTSKVEGTTVSDGSEYDIDLTAEYNEKENTVVTTLTNNTGDFYVFQEPEHDFYKQKGNDWENITFDYGTLLSSQSISPKAGENIYIRSIAAYPNSNSNENDIDKAMKTKYFTPGKYKVAVKISVCVPTEYMEVKNDGKTETMPIPEKNKVTFSKEAVFTVE